MEADLQKEIAEAEAEAEVDPILRPLTVLELVSLRVAMERVKHLRSGDSARLLHYGVRLWH
jgi:hypothetical protein